MTGFRVTEKPQVLGFPWWTEADKYGLNSQVLICEEQVVWFLPREEMRVGCEWCRAGDSGSSSSCRGASLPITPPEPPDLGNCASKKVLLQRCGFRLFNLPLWKRGKGEGRWQMQQEQSGETLPSASRLGLNLWTAEGIVCRVEDNLLLMIQTRF